MSEKRGGTASVPLFLAHSLALEKDAMGRYDDLSRILDSHNNPQVSALFHDMKNYAELHVNEVTKIAETVGGIPAVAPLDFVWYTEEPPEAAPFEEAHYLMTPRQALEVALDCEKRAQDYYTRVATETADPEVAKLAHAFAAEEGGHVELLQAWLERLPPTKPGWSEDLDEPRSPD